MKPLISIIIINKNDRAIAKTLRVCSALTDDYSYELIVVDSSRGKLDDLYKKFPKVKLIAFTPKAHKPITIPEARNTGVQAAQGDIIVFIDANCVPKAHWLTNLVKPIIEEQEAIVAGATVSRGKATTHDQSYKDMQDKQYIDECPTINLAIDRTLFHTVGGFDEHFDYGSDVDFSWRVIAAGYQVRYQPTAVISHDWGDSKQELKRAYLYGIARTRLYLKHRNLHSLLTTDITLVIYPLFIIGLPLTLVWPWYPFLLLIPALRNYRKKPLDTITYHLSYAVGALHEVCVEPFHRQARKRNMSLGEMLSPKGLIALLHRSIKHALPDGVHVRLMYLLVNHQILRLRHPQSYSEKIQWLKVYGNLAAYSSYADKYEVREYVRSAIGSKYLIPLIGAWDTFDEIPFDTLPDQFVMKASHGSGYNIIVTDKKTVDKEDMRRKMTQWLGENYYEVSREAQYKLCTPKIVVERYIAGDGGELKDYKLYCFNGQPELLMIANDRHSNMTIDVVDTSWNRLPVLIGDYPPSETLPDQPAQFDTMLDLAAKLSADFPFVRVDLYTAHNKVYFGELTFTPSSGLELFGSPEFGQWFGGKIDLAAYPIAGK